MTVSPDAPDEHAVPPGRSRAHVPTPADLGRATARELFEGWQSHTSLLVDAQHGLSKHPVSPGRLATAALDALATGAALAEHVQNFRWITCIDALRNGATVADVAAAMGLDVDEVVYGLRSWADGQLTYCGMTDDEHRAVIALVPDPSTPPRA